MYVRASTRRKQRKYRRLVPILAYPAIIGLYFCYLNFQAWFEYTLKLDIREEWAANHFVKLDYSPALWLFSLFYILVTTLIVGQPLLDFRINQMQVYNKKKSKRKLATASPPELLTKRLLTLPFLKLNVPRQRSFALLWLMESSAWTIFYFFSIGLILASIKSLILPTIFLYYAREYIFFLVFFLTSIVSVILLVRDLLRDGRLRSRLRTDVVK